MGKFRNFEKNTYARVLRFSFGSGKWYLHKIGKFGPDVKSGPGEFSFVFDLNKQAGYNYHFISIKNILAPKTLSSTQIS